MIIDSHCHAWSYWPYQPAVPDPETRGVASQLLNEMELNGIDQALLVCAQIEHNPHNNANIAVQVQQVPQRLHQLVDLDSEWSPRYHTPGAAQRPRQFAARWPICGFTHYLRPRDDGEWLNSADGKVLLRAAADQEWILGGTLNQLLQASAGQSRNTSPS
jgi:L-fuconolactonase